MSSEASLRLFCNKVIPPLPMALSTHSPPHKKPQHNLFCEFGSTYIREGFIWAAGSAGLIPVSFGPCALTSSSNRRRLCREGLDGSGDCLSPERPAGEVGPRWHLDTWIWAGLPPRPWRVAHCASAVCTDSAVKAEQRLLLGIWSRAPRQAEAAASPVKPRAPGLR